MFSRYPWEASSFLNKGNREEVGLGERGNEAGAGRGGGRGNCSRYVMDESKKFEKKKKIK